MAAGHTGGMVALVPSDWRPLAITDGEPGEDLHLTLAYLGDDVTGWVSQQREAVLRLGQGLADVRNPVEARIFAHAKFNPDGGPNGDMEPCLVYLIGDGADIADLRDAVLNRLREEIGEAMLPEQHTPFVPHVTAAYGRDLKYGLFTTGPIVFDRLRVALGDDVTDFPLGGDVQAPEDQPDRVDAWFEQKVMSPDPRAAELRSYWVGQYGKKWYKWRELHKHLRKYVKNPNILDGLTTNIYRLATGHMPPRAKKSAREGLLSEMEIKAAMVLADPDADDFDRDFLDEWLDEDQDDEPDDDDADALYEQALVDAVDWRIDADGSLVRDDEDDDEDDGTPDGDEVSSGPRTPVSMGPSLFDLYPE